MISTERVLTNFPQRLSQGDDLMCPTACSNVVSLRQPLRKDLAIGLHSCTSQSAHIAPPPLCFVDLHHSTAHAVSCPTHQKGGQKHERREVGVADVTATCWTLQQGNTSGQFLKKYKEYVD